RIGELARNSDAESVLLTFFPHPRLVLFPDDNDLKLLSTRQERIELLESAGLDHLVIHPFSTKFSRITADSYIRDVLVGQFNVGTLVIGYDHHFGRNREGNLDRLKEAAPIYGFTLEEIPAQEIDDVNVSSTKIRKALVEGDVVRANEYLGYTYSLSGVVGKGNELGRTLGFPTANIRPPETYKLIPGNGIYAVYGEIEGVRYPGMANIGIRPTIGDIDTPLVEVHLFDFHGDLYNKEMKVYFVERYRDEVKFHDLESLRLQMVKDEPVAREILDRNPDVRLLKLGS
ncbi:MAG TPA: riboflavin biosynthesis protein RibF, partial [Cryomorphaceae bacterium]|nr:riboflavin biosynthesis protein RibF [Cryomorphaceae bacterium]